MSNIEDENKIEAGTLSTTETEGVVGDPEISQKVEDVLSLEGFIQSSEYKAFMQNMAENLPELNALLNSKDECIEIIKKFDEIVRKSSDNQAKISMYGIHCFTANQLVFNILYNKYELTKISFGPSGNAKTQAGWLLRRSAFLDEITEIQIGNRNHFLDSLEKVLKRLFELWLGKENVK